jgi:hypothetical protein
VRPRSRRVLVYTLSLLLGFMPLMPFEPRTREFQFALIATCAILIVSGLYVIRGERMEKSRPMYAVKLMIAATITTFAAIVVLLLDIVALLRR